MPLLENEVQVVRKRVLLMVMDTIETVKLINENSPMLFGESSDHVSKAIDEFLIDFIDNPNQSKQIHPERLIYAATREKFQDAGLYGAQLSLKERQVTESNKAVRESLAKNDRSFFRSPFKSWIDRINNFLGSVIPATGFGEALKELKDCLRDELPND